MLVLLLLCLLIFGGGFGYWGSPRWGAGPAWGGGLGVIIFILLVLWLFGYRM